MEFKKKPHVHCELIKAWADGAEIQFWENGKWYDCNNKPSWFPDIEYRIKPEPTDAEKHGVEVGDVWYTPYFRKFYTIQNVENDKSYVGGKFIKTLDGSKVAYGFFIEDKFELVFRRGVVNLL